MDLQPIDWRAFGVEMRARMDAKDARRIEKARRFGLLAKGIPALEVHHGTYPSERTVKDQNARLFWHRNLNDHIRKSLPRLGRWRATKATKSNHQFRKSGREWPTALREDWEFTDGSEPSDYEAYYDTHEEFARECDAIWANEDEHYRGLRNKRARALLQLVFCRVYYGVRLVRALEARKVARAPTPGVRKSVHAENGSGTQHRKYAKERHGRERSASAPHRARRGVDD